MEPFAKFPIHVSNCLWSPHILEACVLGKPKFRELPLFYKDLRNQSSN